MKDLIDKYRMYGNETRLALDCIKRSEKEDMSYSHLNLAENIIDCLEINMNINNPDKRYDSVIGSLREKLNQEWNNNLNNRRFAA